MLEKITNILREYVVPFSIIITIIGLFLISTSVIYYFLSEIHMDYISQIGDWNAYVLVIGFIAFGTGIYYIYSYWKNRKFILEETQTNKRSEFLKKHTEVKNRVKHLPKKYKKMVKDKEHQLRVK